MREQVIQQLKEFTPKMQEKQKTEIYVDRVLDQKEYLKEGRVIAVRPHFRFTCSPEHRHNYIEMMYVCQGSVTHCIEGKEVTMRSGDLLLMNQYVKHSVKTTGSDDIAINFIALPEFFEIPLKMLQGNNILADFLVNTLCSHHQKSDYLLFHLSGKLEIENLMENMIISMLNEENNSDSLNQYSMGLVFLYLMNHVDRLTTNTLKSTNNIIIQSVLDYIDKHYKTAKLEKIAEDFHRSLPALSKMIKQKTGFTFQELLQEKRFEKAASYLEETNLSIEEIIVAVGYENQSYFYRKYKEKYGMTPRDYRMKNKKRK